MDQIKRMEASSYAIQGEIATAQKLKSSAINDDELN